jgi:hypothetical protein
VRSILAGQAPDSGKQGYYLAASGSVLWTDLYAVCAATLAKRGIIEDADVLPATQQALDEMAVGLACPRELVALQLGGT